MRSYVLTVPTSVTAGTPIITAGKPSHAGDPDSVLIKAPSSNAATVYLGGPDVSSSNGYPLAPGDPAIGLDANATENVYAVSGTANQKLQVLKKYDQ